jgi:hypothetical protein
MPVLRGYRHRSAAIEGRPQAAHHVLRVMTHVDPWRTKL